MANFIVSATVRDADGNRSSTNIHVPRGSLTLAAIEGFAEAWLGVLDGASDGVIESGRVTLEVDVPGTVKPTPVAGSNVQEGGLVQFDADNTSYAYSMRIPAFAQAAFTGKEINWAHGAALAFKNIMLSGQTHDALLVTPSDKYGNDLLDVVSGVKSFRRK